MPTPSGRQRHRSPHASLTLEVGEAALEGLMVSTRVAQVQASSGNARITAGVSTACISGSTAASGPGAITVTANWATGRPRIVHPSPGTGLTGVTALAAGILSHPGPEERRDGVGVGMERLRPTGRRDDHNGATPVRCRSGGGEPWPPEMSHAGLEGRRDGLGVGGKLLASLATGRPRSATPRPGPGLTEVIAIAAGDLTAWP